jgi:hypothetical protein
MEKKLTAWLATLLGIILILPLIGVTQLGTATSGILGWILALAVLIIGLAKLFTLKK